MAKPKAKLTADKNDLFINPYNFVSLSSSVDRKNISDESGDDKLTGGRLVGTSNIYGRLSGKNSPLRHFSNTPRR